MMTEELEELLGESPVVRSAFDFVAARDNTKIYHLSVEQKKEALELATMQLVEDKKTLKEDLRMAHENSVRPPTQWES